MMKDLNTRYSIMPDIAPPRPFPFQTLSMLFSMLFLILLVLLHLLSPGIEASWRMVIDYGNTPQAWMLQTAFTCLGLSLIFLFLTLKKHVKTSMGNAGLLLLWLMVLGLVISALFPSDTPLNSMLKMTKISQIGFVGFSVVLFSAPIVSLLISISLLKTDSTWTWMAITWLLPLMLLLGGFLWMLAVIVVNLIGNEEIILVRLGWSNRLLFLGLSLWIFSLSFRAHQVRR